MKNKNAVAALLLLLLLSSGCSSVKNIAEPGNGGQTVVLVSLDAFRWDYDSIYSTPVLDKIAHNGVMAERMIPSFPTKTFPNHYTIATGLYPDHHGLINNTFYAPDLHLLYRIGDRSKVENPLFYGGEPVWVTAHKAGMVTASFYWVGSEAPILGVQPDYWKVFDNSVTFGARVDTVLKWLSYPKAKRPRLVTLYFEEPDAVSHTYGPLSPETGAMVHSLDSLLGVLREGLKRTPGAENINLIVVSDHGMGETDQSRYNNLYDTLPKRLVKNIAGGSPVWMCEPVEGKADSVIYFINMQKGVRAYHKADLPGYLHYGTHPRMTEIVVVADPRWIVGIRTEVPTGKGDHGYDWTFRDMHSIFYGEGPSFKRGAEADTLYNVDVYNIICRILNLKPAPNDGSPERIAPLFR